MNRTFCSTLALYATKSKYLDFTSWSNLIKKFAENLNISLNYLGIGSDSDKIPEEFIPIKEGEKFLIDENPNSIYSLSYCSTLTGSDSPAYDWVFYASNGTAEWGQELVIGIDKQLLDIQDSRFKKLFIKNINSGDFSYGIGLEQRFEEHPTLYALGGANSYYYEAKGEYLKAELISEWQRDMFDRSSYKDGFFRNVYPLNLLNEFHLNFEIGNMKFRDLIIKEGIGTLEKLSENLWLWTLNAEQIKKAKVLLGNVGRIIEHPNFQHASQELREFIEQNPQAGTDVPKNE